MNYFQFHIGDYAQATSHLTLVEDAIYWRLLRRYYAEEKPLVDDVDQLCRWVGARSDQEQQAVRAVLKEFFSVADGCWRNKRADEELQRYRERAEINRANGRLSRGRPKRSAGNPEETHSVSTGMPRGSESPPDRGPAEADQGASGNQVATLTKNQEPATKGSASPAAPRIDPARGSRLPADWTLPDEWRHWAATERPDLDLDALAAKFRDYWVGKAGKEARKADWLATWRNFVRNERAPFGRGGETGHKQWWESASGIRAKGDELKVLYRDSMATGNAWLHYVARVWVAAGDGPHWDEGSGVYQIAARMRNGTAAGSVQAALQGLDLSMFRQPGVPA